MPLFLHFLFPGAVILCVIAGGICWWRERCLLPTKEASEKAFKAIECPLENWGPSILTAVTALCDKEGVNMERGMKKFYWTMACALLLIWFVTYIVHQIAV